jgi:hypothetical protein
MRLINHKVTDFNTSIADKEEVREITEDDYINFFKGLIVSCVGGAIIYAVLILTILHFI